MLKKNRARLVTLGLEGSYNRVAVFAQEWRGNRQRESQTTGHGNFAPLAFRPGEALQFDWSENFAVLVGERTKLQDAQIKLPYSRALLLRSLSLAAPLDAIFRSLARVSRCW